MDKYTIDLDKVLNDFEYSELTEESNGYNTVSSNNITSQSVYNYSDKNYKHDSLPNAQTYPKVPSTTKHSINNVFHSLNEYLNSDIKDINPELSEINEIETRIPSFVSKPQTSIQDLFKDVSTELNTVENACSTTDLVSNEFLQCVNSNTTLSYVSSKTTLIPSILNTDSKQSLLDSESFEDQIPAKNDSTDIIVSDLLPNNQITSDFCDKTNFMNTNTTTSLSDVKSNSSFIATDYKTVSDSQQYVISQQESKHYSHETQNKTLQDHVSDKVKNKYDHQTIEKDNKIDTEVSIESDISTKISKTSENLISEKNIYYSENTKIEEICSDTEIIPNDTSFQATTPNSEQNSDNVISEPSNTQLNQEIKNDLTKNTNITSNNSIPSDIKTVEITDSPKSNIEKYDYQLSMETPESTEIKITVGFEPDFEISDTEMENELEKLEEEYKEKIEIEAKNLEENCETDIVNNVNDKEIETMNEIVISEDVQDEETSENVNIVQVKQIENELVEEKVTKVIDETELNANREDFSLLRPNSLDINSETPENTPIDLIGDPGSTPYNNVYVENTIKTNTTPKKNPETELNNSLSPTVSEVSTSEASDSPNTSDSCNDTSLDDNLNDTTKSTPTNENTPKTDQGSSGDNKDLVSNSIGKTAPFWTPDSEAMNCLHCNLKFTVVKRRHHCRACGLVLCSKCCSLKYKLEYMDNQEARVCTKCFGILSGENGERPIEGEACGSSRPLNPANPMEYCSVVPPLQQVGNLPVVPPSVMVPVGVLKRKGSGKSRSGKSVMFCDGIRPGCDLTELDYDFNYKASQTSSPKPLPQNLTSKINRNLPKMDPKTNSYIPSEENSLPPTVNVLKSEITYTDCANNLSVVEMLKNEKLTFALQRNLHIYVKIINMDCCINKQAWCFTTEGMITVGQDEIIILLEFVDNEKTVPKDVFLHLNNIFSEAVKGTSITEMGLSIHNNSNLLESKNHAGFLYIKPSFQCVQNLILPKEPYLIGILIHRWETPWAKIFPLRLLLRLGAEYRYYPSPIISTRHRESVYVEIGHTIINLLADFRNFSYTLPNVRGLTIHMKEKNTTVSIPQNRYDQVMKALNNSSDHILAFSANFSPTADSHLVCIQDTHGNNENAYTTHAINIHNKPRKVTGASFIVLNGALKSSSGLTAKSSIVEDGLMIQILPDQMVKLRNSLRNMKDFKINCGCVNAQSDEFVNIVWTENDINFNVGVISPIDNMSLSGVPSIRVHNGKDFVCNSGNKMIRWTEVFIIQSGDENTKTQDPVDISKLSESISKATCQALVKYLDLLATNSFLKIGIRTNLHVENVSYLAGSNGLKLPPIYMKSLDNELIPILHKITSNNLGENAIVIELIFHILNI